MRTRLSPIRDFATALSAFLDHPYLLASRNPNQIVGANRRETQARLRRSPRASLRSADRGSDDLVEYTIDHPVDGVRAIAKEKAG